MFCALDMSVHSTYIVYGVECPCRGFHTLVMGLSAATQIALHWCAVVTPQSRGSVDYPSTRGIQVEVGLPDATLENRAESPLYGELYPIKIPA